MRTTRAVLAVVVGALLTLGVAAQSPSPFMVSGVPIPASAVNGAGAVTGCLTWLGDTGVCRLSAGVLGIGNGTAGDFSGTVKTTTVFLQKLWSIPATNLDIHAGSAGTLVRFLNYADNSVNLSVDDSGNQILRGALSSIGGVSTTGSYGVPLTTGTTGLLSAQGADIALTNVIASTPTDGMYLVCAWASVTRAATTSSTLPYVTVSWNNGTASQANQLTGSDSSNTTATYKQGCVQAHIGSGQALKYSATGYASVGATSMQYEAWVTATLVK